MNLYGFIGNDPVNYIDMWGLFFGYVLEERSRITQNASIAAGQWLVNRGFPGLGEAVAAVGEAYASTERDLAGKDPIKNQNDKAIHTAEVLYEKGLREGFKQLADEQLEALIYFLKDRIGLHDFDKATDPCNKLTWFERYVHTVVGITKVAETAITLFLGGQAIKNWKNRKFGSKNKPSQKKKIENKKPRPPKKEEYGPTKRRVKPRKRTKEAVTEKQPRNADGDMVDPHTKKPFKEGEIDLGHKDKPWRKRKVDYEKEGLTRKKVIERENDPSGYHWEDRHENRSHKWE